MNYLKPMMCHHVESTVFLDWNPCFEFENRSKLDRQLTFHQTLLQSFLFIFDIPRVGSLESSSIHSSDLPHTGLH